MMPASIAAANIMLHTLIGAPEGKPWFWTITDLSTADCPKKLARNWSDQCAARCPDFATVL
jgi:hypothetical protein